MALGEKGEVRTPEQIVFPIAPCFDLAVDIGEPLLGIESVDDIVGVLEQIFEILLGLFNFPRALPDFDPPTLLGRFPAAVRAASGR